MKAYIQKREKLLHLFSLLIVASSIFVDDFLTKMGLVVMGILGLVLIGWAKGNRTTFLIYLGLLLAALFYGYYMGDKNGLFPEKL